MAYCLGVYPKPIARFMRWVVNQNPKRTVALRFKGRKPKAGYKYGRGGELPLANARRVAVYVDFNPHAPVNKAHKAGAEQQAKRVLEYKREQRIEPWNPPVVDEWSQLRGNG